MGFKAFMKRRSLRVRDDQTTKAAELTLRESLYPIFLVTILFFLWGFSYGLLDTLNKHFQNTLGIGRARSSGLQAAYFGYGSPFSLAGRAMLALSNFLASLALLMVPAEPILSPLLVMRLGFSDTSATEQSSCGACSSTVSALC